MDDRDDFDLEADETVSKKDLELFEDELDELRELDELDTSENTLEEEAAAAGGRA